MKKIFLLAAMMTLRICFADVNPSNMSSTTVPSSKIQEFKHLDVQKTTPSTTTPAKPPTLPPMVKAPQQVPQHAEYLHPGILVNINGRWEGSDHLLNLSNNIGVYVTLIRPPEEQLEISEGELQKMVESMFGQAGIKPLTLGLVGKAPLPAFEIEIFVYPIEKGYAACVNGRLFESVILERFNMDPNMAFQAITWEKQTLIVSPKARFGEQLSKTVQEITGAFIERFQTYERLKRTGTY